MKKTLLRDFIRSLGNNPARFFSILFIIALGVGFFAGINAARPDMEKSASKYYKDTNLMDVRSMNPLGFSEDEIKAVKDVPGVSQVMESYRKDLFAEVLGNKSVMRLFSMDLENNGKNAMNKMTVTEGRLPEKEDELVLNTGKFQKFQVKIGDKITLSLPEGEKSEDFLKRTEFKVVGFIESPLYVSFNRDRTNVGSGVIEVFGYIPGENFTQKEPTELFIKTVNSENMDPSGEEYKKSVTAVKEKLDSMSRVYMADQTEDLRKDLMEGKKELEDKKKEADEGLGLGFIKLMDSEKTLLINGEKLNDSVYRGGVKIADAREEIASKKEELISGREEYENGLSEWNEGNRKYLDGKSQLDQGKAQLDSAKSQLTSAYNQLISAKGQLDTFADAVNQLITIRNNLSNPLSYEDIQNIAAAVNQYAPETAQYISQWITPDNPDAAGSAALAIDSGIEYIRSFYNSQLNTYNSGLSQYESGLSEYESGLSQYNSSKAELDAAKTEVDSGKKELDDAASKLREGENEIRKAENLLDKNEKDLLKAKEDGDKKIASGWEAWEEGYKTYEEEKEDAEKKIADADDEILKAERDIKEIPEKWFTYDRDGNPDYTSYFDNAVKIGNVAKVFPLFFFLVAALVSLTTITRMVDEERQAAGTLRALGYGTSSVSAKYIGYALLASVLGSALGLTAGFNIFPRVIMNAYNLMYSIPASVIEFNLLFALISTAFAVLSSLGAAMMAISGSSKETPAALMQPKAPPAGKRIFLEKIGFIWKRLKFSQKVTMRNLFLYKKRLLMTILGIAGCTALILTGFGIRDSVGSMVANQFRQLFIYDEMIVADTDKDPSERDISSIVSAIPEITAWGENITQSINVRREGSDRTYDTELVVPENPEELSNFIVLRDRKTKTPIPLEEGGAVITEKLAETLGVKPGDSVKYTDVDNNEFSVKVTGIAENYLNNYLYMTPDTYEKTHLLKPEYNSAWLTMTPEDVKNEENINTEIMKNRGILTVVSAAELSEQFENQISSLQTVVYVLILSAGLLAFIVLYNLSNVNITERKRELATIKVLGFRDNEVSAYIYRENIILTFMGSAAGLILGVFLHRFIMKTLEIDNLMFGKDILIPSYFYSVAITFLFSAVVNVIMHLALKKIDMVESLKSVE